MSQIQTAVTAAMRDIAGKGIGKTQKNEAQGYRFRGVEQAMNELSPILVNNGITVTPTYSELVVSERVKGDPKDGKATRFVTIKGTFEFTAEDDSKQTSEAYGEAMDSGDKAVIKAQSVAFRTALFQKFVVPTMSMDTELDHGDDDGDDASSLERRRRKWLDDQIANINEASTVGGLKKVMEYAVGVTRENNDQAGEDELTAAAAAKVAKANPGTRRAA
jgi:hypothetical protein